MRISKLGPIKQGEVVFSDLTILCGSNNVGKTYLSYALYGILSNLTDLINGFLLQQEAETLLEKGEIVFTKSAFFGRTLDVILQGFNSRKNEILENVFRSDQNQFSESMVNMDKEELAHFLNLNKIHMPSLTFRSLNVSLENRAENYAILIIKRKTEDSENLNDHISVESLKLLIDSLISFAMSSAYRTFYVPAERIGINVFRSQLNANKIEWFDAINDVVSRHNKTEKELQKELLMSLNQITDSYPLPISDYLNYINKIKRYDDATSTSEVSDHIRKRLIKGKFVVDHQTSKSYYQSQIGENKYETDRIPLHITSSAIKSLYGLDYYFEQMSKDQQHVIIIDEPEMNLHPANQAEFAKLLNLIVKSGIKVVISTHSDFLVKKIQNIMLKNKLDDSISGLNPQNVRVYAFEEGNIQEIDLLSDTEPFDNFDKTVAEIEDEYLDLLQQLTEKRIRAEGIYES